MRGIIVVVSSVLGRVSLKGLRNIINTALYRNTTFHCNTAMHYHTSLYYHASLYYQNALHYFSALNCQTALHYQTALYYQIILYYRVLRSYIFGLFYNFSDTNLEEEKKQLNNVKFEVATNCVNSLIKKYDFLISSSSYFY